MIATQSFDDLGLLAITLFLMIRRLGRFRLIARSQVTPLIALRHNRPSLAIMKSKTPRHLIFGDWGSDRRLVYPIEDSQHLRAILFSL